MERATIKRLADHGPSSVICEFPAVIDLIWSPDDDAWYAEVYASASGQTLHMTELLTHDGALATARQWCDAPKV